MRQAVHICAMLLLGIITLAIALNLHELGHTLAARIAGDHEAMYYLYKHEPGHGLCIGCNIYDEQRLSYLGNLAVTIAGVMSTQLIAVLCLMWRSSIQRGSSVRRILLIVASVFMFDAPLQVFQALLADVATQQHLTRVDLADTLYLLMQSVPVPSSVLKAALLACLALYGFSVFWIFARRPNNSSKPTPLRGAA